MDRWSLRVIIPSMIIICVAEIVFSWFNDQPNLETWFALFGITMAVALTIQTDDKIEKILNRLKTEDD